MPYAIRKRNGKYVVINAVTLDVKGTHDSEVEAQLQINLLRGVEHGWRPTYGEKRK